MTVHPNSLANLRAPWPKGAKIDNSGWKNPGLKFAPALHKYADKPFDQVLAIAKDYDRAAKLPTIEVIAITTLVKAATDVQWGDSARQLVADRLDGKVDRSDAHVEINDNRVTIIREVHTSTEPRQLG